MPKIPDFSELTKKLDLQGMVESFKSVIGSGPAKIPEGNEITVKFAELAALSQKLATVNAEQSQAIAELYAKINNLAKDVQILTAVATIAKAAQAAPDMEPKPDEEKKD